MLNWRQKYFVVELTIRVTFPDKPRKKELYFPALSLQPLEIETTCLSETSASTCKYTWRQNPR
jgi:hypothetical protein